MKRRRGAGDAPELCDELYDQAAQQADAGMLGCYPPYGYGYPGALCCDTDALILGDHCVSRTAQSTLVHRLRWRRVAP